MMQCDWLKANLNPRHIEQFNGNRNVKSASTLITSNINTPKSFLN